VAGHQGCESGTEVGTAFVIAALDPKRALLLTAAHNLKAVHRLDDPPRHHFSTPDILLPRPAEWIDLKSSNVVRDAEVIVGNGASRDVAVVVQLGLRRRAPARDYSTRAERDVYDAFPARQPTRHRGQLP